MHRPIILIDGAIFSQSPCGEPLGRCAKRFGKAAKGWRRGLPCSKKTRKRYLDMMFDEMTEGRVFLKRFQDAINPRGGSVATKNRALQRPDHHAKFRWWHTGPDKGVFQKTQHGHWRKVFGTKLYKKMQKTPNLALRQ